MRVKHKPWAKDYINTADQIFINSYIDNDNLVELLNNYDNILMEIGTGKGKFIYENAKQNPNNLYIGVEKQASVIVSAAKIQEENPLNNLKFYYGDIFNLNGNNLLREKIAKIFLNFSDPWPKKRHAKRRLVHPTFLKLYYNLLNETGEIEIKTDNESLFEYSILTINNSRLWEVEEVCIDLHNKEKKDIITTEYEDKFLKLGINIKFMKIKKKFKGN